MIRRFPPQEEASSLALLIRLSLLWSACRAGRLQAGIEDIHRQRPLLCVWCQATLKTEQPVCQGLVLATNAAKAHHSGQLTAEGATAPDPWAELQIEVL